MQCHGKHLKWGPLHVSFTSRFYCYYYYCYYGIEQQQLLCGKFFDSILLLFSTQLVSVACWVISLSCQASFGWVTSYIYTKIEHHRCCQWSHLHSINRTLTFSNENDDELVLFIRASSHFFGLCATAMRRHSLGAQRWNTHIWFVRNWTCSNARETFCFDIDFLILTPNLIFVCRMEIWFTWKEMGKNIRLFCCSKRWGNSVFFFFLCLGINRHVL